jgi:hypothetical protein
MRTRTAPLACVALLAALAACGPDAGTDQPSLLPAGPPQPWQAQADRLPTSLGAFRRGTPVALTGAAAGREFPYATPGRGIAGHVQVRAGAALDANAELERFLHEVGQEAAAHRRVAARSAVTIGGFWRCTELEGVLGRQPVEGLACAAVHGGNTWRLRLSMVRREGRMEEARGFAAGVAAALSR